MSKSQLITGVFWSPPGCRGKEHLYKNNQNSVVARGFVAESAVINHCEGRALRGGIQSFIGDPRLPIPTAPRARVSSSGGDELALASTFSERARATSSRAPMD